MIAHYLIFHPERQRINATVKVLRNNLIYECDRDILIDRIANGSGNEDPFVFSNPWLYSFCHATELKRAPKEKYVQPGSILIFVNSKMAEQGILKIDTVFHVRKGLVWPKKATIPPAEYSDRNSDIWFRHIRHGIRPLNEKGHKGEYTYEATMYSNSNKDFSFLPIFNQNCKGIDLVLEFSNLWNRLKSELYGKKPFPLEEPDVKEILNLLDKNTSEKVVEIVGVKGFTNDLGVSCHYCADENSEISCL
ncbi:MAG: hypothetical protein HXX13_08785 [Bacteroidetes bacterium]|nr:hypothetical protein [Bacteroidota bacterium]